MKQAGYKEEGEVKCLNRVLEDWKCCLRWEEGHIFDWDALSVCLRNVWN